MNPLFRAGLRVAMAVAAADWLSKYYVLRVLRLPEVQSIAILPFLDLTMVWNRGISFGLFPADGAYGRAVLIGFAGALSIVLAIWLWRSKNLLEAAALGAILGGALGNIYDRFVFGAVADFFDFHLMGYHWYVFNVADAAISIGVVLLLAGSFLITGKPDKSNKT